MEAYPWLFPWFKRPGVYLCSVCVQFVRASRLKCLL